MNIPMVNLLLCEAHNAFLNFLRSKFIQRHNNRFNELYTFPMSHLYIMKTLTPSQLINLTAQTINSMFENWNQTMPTSTCVYM